MKTNTFLGALFTTAAAISLLASPPPGLTPAETRVAALALLTIGFWATGVIAEHITSLLFFVLAMLFSVAAPATIFSGFYSTAVWLIFGGLVIGVAIMATGLGRRVAAWAASRLDGSYLRIITGLVAAGVLFSFLMPSAMGRVVLLTPIAQAMASHFGFRPGSRGRTGVILATILGSFLPAFAILPANVPNMVLVGMAGTQYQISLLYGSYLLLHFPVLGLVKAALIVALILWFYPDTPRPVPHTELTSSGPMTRNERILSWSLFLMLGLWMTDFLHHVSPAWIALAGAVFLMLPGITIVNREQFNQKINWASLVFVAGILGLGAMINQSGLGDTLARKLISVLPLG
ncbi:MAG TPA: SLC13 family permease, partial [Desulfobulbus sp.]|nr:SLC13 family permease [Desulfobulbus sp.]